MFDNLRPDHEKYLVDRGVNLQLLAGRYFSDGEHLAIRYCEPQGEP